MSIEIERLLAGLKPAPPPHGVGARVVAAARRAEPRGVSRPTMVDRLWGSTRLWLAWAAAVTVLVGINVALHLPERQELAGRGSTVVVIEELAIITTAPNMKTGRQTLADSAGLLRAILNVGAASGNEPSQGESA